MRQGVGVIAASAVLVVSMPAVGQAQSASPTVATTAGTPPIGVAPVPNQNTPGEDLRPAASPPSQTVVTTGLFPSVGNQLLNDGIDIHGAILDHSLTNPSVGNTSQLAIFRQASTSTSARSSACRVDSCTPR